MLNKPNFFIVGAPKCGTTAMNDYLAQHPDIFMAKKEIHYFGSDLKTKHKISNQEYLDCFAGAGNKRIIGEASVWYLFSADAAKEIKQFSPDAKILIMLRNPVDVVYSLHSQHLYDGNEDVRDFETALALDEERRKGNRLPNSVDYYELPPYRDSVLFSVQVKRYLDTFGAANVHIVLYDDFVANTAKAYSEMLRFLEIENSIVPDFTVINPNKEIASFSMHRLVKAPPSTLRKIVRVILPLKGVRHFIMSFIVRRNVSIKKRKDMSDDIRRSLCNEFLADIKKLERLIDRDLSAWTSEL